LNWDALGAIAELAGAIGVIFSLLYLGIQIRDQNRESRLNTIREASRQWNEVLGSTADNHQLCEVWVDGLADFERMNSHDRAQFSAQAGRVLRILEGMWEHQQEGRLKPSLWDAMNETLKDVLAYPGGRAWWATRSHWYTSEFQQYIEGVIAETALTGNIYNESNKNDA